jgi:hypothetical protein
MSAVKYHPRVSTVYLFIPHCKPSHSKCVYDLYAFCRVGLSAYTVAKDETSEKQYCGSSKSYRPIEKCVHTGFSVALRPWSACHAITTGFTIQKRFMSFASLICMTAFQWSLYSFMVLKNRTSVNRKKAECFIIIFTNSHAPISTNYLPVP